MPIDMSAAKAPPRKRNAGGPTMQLKTIQPEVLTPREKRDRGLNGLAQLAQGLCLMTGLNADAAAIGMFFPSIATELAGVAETSEMVAKPIDFLIEIGPYGGLIAAVMPFALQIAANHRMLDASRLASQGVVPPEVLEAQMQAKVARLQADALREQQAAVQEAQAAMREFEAMSREPQRVA